ncbi:MAG: ABC-F family ATP-binding cassette domain-containing protein [Alphaproteobacteria bacterium]|nr:ABC-F family ATP-binding cassette domain-containing protein [Alphaproteobacteria bacterium]
MLTISDLVYKIDNRVLLDKASVVVPAGSKTGFVGRNGSGKTTLFRLIMHEMLPDDGDIEVHPRARIGTVAQEAPATRDSVLDMVMKADTERAALMREAEDIEDGHRIAEIHARLVDIDAHSAEARASSILRGLGFAHERQKGSCSELSGGWRMRVSLAGVLFSRPDLLLLDEPTNYLDLEGTLWLENYLASYPYTVIMISHDRNLLNKAATSIVHLDRGKLTFYRGNYDTFETTRRMQMELAGKTRERTLERVAHMQSFVDRFRYKASKAKQAQARIKMIEKMRPPEALLEEGTLPFSFPNPKRAMASPMLDFENVAVGYTDVPVLRKLNLRIEPDDRIALVGVNGNGKSTFAKLIAGELKPMDGKIRRGRGFETAYFAQHQLDLLKPKKSALEHVDALMWESTEAQRRARVAQIGLSTQKMDTPAENLSGGEKARLLMGLITFTGPSMMILDEPTNHLDIDSRDALTMALNDYRGAVLIISHDRHLIEATVDQIWIAENGTIRVFDGDMADYERILLAGTQSSGGVQKQTAGSTFDRRSQRQEAAERRARLAPLRKQIKLIEDKTARLRTELAKLENRLADPRLYEGAPDEAISLGKDKARFEAGIAELEEAWLARSAELEDAEAAQLVDGDQ